MDLNKLVLLVTFLAPDSTANLLESVVATFGQFSACAKQVFIDPMNTGIISSFPTRVYTIDSKQIKLRVKYPLANFKGIQCLMHFILIHNSDTTESVTPLQQTFIKISSFDIQPHLTSQTHTEAKVLISINNYAIQLTSFFREAEIMNDLMDIPTDRFYFEGFRGNRFYFGILKIRFILIESQLHTTMEKAVSTTKLWYFCFNCVNPQFQEIYHNFPTSHEDFFTKLSAKYTWTVWTMKDMKNYIKSVNEPYEHSRNNYNKQEPKSTNLKTNEGKLIVKTLKQLKQACNITFKGPIRNEPIRTPDGKYTFYPFYPFLKDTLSTELLGMIENSKLGMPSTLATTEQKGFSFLSCQSDQYLSFFTYTQPFETSLWIALFMNLLILATVLHLWFLQSKRTFLLELKTKFSSYFLLFSTALEQCPDVPKFIEETHAFRITFGIWCMMSIIFTNAYKGIAITGITSPLPARQPKYFMDLSEYNFKCEPLSDICKESYDWKRLKIGSSVDFKLFSHPSTYSSEIGDNRWFVVSTKVPSYLTRDPRDTNFGSALESFRKKMIDIYTAKNQATPKKHSWSYESRVLRTFLRLPDKAMKEQEVDRRHKSAFFDSYSRSIPGHWQLHAPPDPLATYLEISIEKELIKCKRTAFVDDITTVINEFNHLTRHYKGWPFVLSTDIILNDHEFYIFFQEGSKCVSNSLKHLIESGIHHFDKSRLSESYYAFRRELTRNSTMIKWQRVKAIEMSDTIQTIYYVSAALILINVLYFYSEFFYSKRMLVIPILRVLSCNAYFSIRVNVIAKAKTNLRKMWIFLQAYCASYMGTDTR